MERCEHNKLQGHCYPCYCKKNPPPEAQQRKEQPVYSGVVKYFPRALKYISEVSLAGNKQHHEDKPLHWDMSKSTDEGDALLRHLIDHAQGKEIDDDGIYHLGKASWRALAILERFLIDKEK